MFRDIPAESVPFGFRKSQSPEPLDEPAVMPSLAVTATAPVRVVNPRDESADSEMQAAAQALINEAGDTLAPWVRRMIQLVLGQGCSDQYRFQSALQVRALCE